MAQGLLPGAQQGLARDRQKFVWLTDCPSFVFDIQAGGDWINAFKPVILFIDCDGLPVASVVNFVRGYACRHEHEYIVPGSIDSTRIKRVRGDLIAL